MGEADRPGSLLSPPDGALGLLLAAGAGSRMGRPKALVHDPDGTSWLVRAVTRLREGGCTEVLVVLGAEAGAARALVPPGTRTVVAPDWAEGMSASLRAGLAAVRDLADPADPADPADLADPADPADPTGPGAHRSDVVVVMLVDLPDVGAAVVSRLLAEGCSPDRLARASYDGQPGHPVLLGRDHWPGVVASLGGDRGAAAYLSDHGAALVECGDLARGHDQDTPLDGLR